MGPLKVIGQALLRAVGGAIHLWITQLHRRIVHPGGIGSRQPCGYIMRNITQQPIQTVKVIEATRLCTDRRRVQTAGRYGGIPRQSGEVWTPSVRG